MLSADIQEVLLAEAASRLLDARTQTIVRVANPAVGTEWVAVVPGGVYWQILNIRFSLTTSAVVINRTCSIQMRDGDNATIARFGPQSTQAQSATSAYNFSSGYGVTNSQALQGAPLPSPPIIIQGGWSFASVTPNLDAGDQYNGIVLMVREFSESQLGQEIRFISQALAAAM